jgi:hypothetical protein
MFHCRRNAAVSLFPELQDGIPALKTEFSSTQIILVTLKFLDELEQITQIFL